MKNFVLSFLIILFSFYLISSSKITNPTEIDSNYITENFNELSKKSNLIQSFTKISKSGNMTLLEDFLLLLEKNKIDFNTEFEAFYQKKHKTLEKVYNKLKYKDEINLKRIAPAFEWA